MPSTENKNSSENYGNHDLKKKKSFAPKLFIILIACTCLLYVSYPFISVKYPNFKKTIDDLRGHYSGPLFIDKNGPGIWLENSNPKIEFKINENKNKFYFRAASDEKYGFFLKTGISRFNISEMNLYEMETGKKISSNKDFAFESGRKATGITAQGKDLPEHANYLEAYLDKGKDYVLEIFPKDKDQVRENARLSIFIAQDEIGLENLWGILIGLITGSYIVFYLLKAFFFIRKNKQEV